MTCHYVVLGLEPPKEPTQYDAKSIRQAYRKKALALHPDKNKDDPDAPAKFNVLTLSFEFLVDDTKREEYDLKLLQKGKSEPTKHEYQPPLFKPTRDLHKQKEVDAARRRFAEELRRREEAHKKAQQEESDLKFVGRAFKSKPAVPPEDQDFHARAVKHQAAINRKLLEVAAARTDRTTFSDAKSSCPSASSVPNSSSVKSETAAADKNFYYILRVQWPSHDSRSEKVLQDTLGAFRPYKLVGSKRKPGVAKIQFYAQDMALRAALHLSMMEDYIFSSRVIRKRRAPSSRGIVEDEDEELDRLIEIKLQHLQHGCDLPVARPGTSSTLTEVSQQSGPSSMLPESSVSSSCQSPVIPLSDTSAVSSHPKRNIRSGGSAAKRARLETHDEVDLDKLDLASLEAETFSLIGL